MDNIKNLNKAKKSLKFTVKKDITGWLIMLPSVILFTFFVWQPILKSIQISFYSTKGFNINEFVGLKNYAAVFNDPLFMTAMKNTFVYIFWSLLVGFLVPIIMSVLLNEIVTLKSLMRVGMYFPNIVPGVATFMMWGLIMTPGDSGILNRFIGIFGIPAQNWLENPKMTIALIVITMTWKSAGSTALIYLARLQNINQELYEAAAIDGAGIWRRIINVTIPNLFSTGRTLLILQIISVFQVLYEPMVMTGGGPNNASISLMQLNYRYAFVDMKASKAVALGVIICIILATLTLLYNRINRKDLDY